MAERCWVYDQIGRHVVIWGYVLINANISFEYWIIGLNIYNYSILKILL